MCGTSDLVASLSFDLLPLVVVGHHPGCIDLVGTEIGPENAFPSPRPSNIHNPLLRRNFPRGGGAQKGSPDLPALRVCSIDLLGCLLRDSREQGSASAHAFVCDDAMQGFLAVD